MTLTEEEKIIAKEKWRAYRKKYADLHKEEKRLYDKEYRKKNKEKIGQQIKEYRALNKDKVRKYAYNYHRTQRLKEQYNITLEDYNKLFEEQNECCVICGKNQSEFSKKLFVDHNHETGKIRGLLCYKCNACLGYFNDNISTFQKAIEYLSK